MKRIVALLLCVLMILSFTACAQTAAEIVFSDGGYARTQAYPASFATKDWALDDISVHIADTIFEDETARALTNTVLSDYACLRDFGGDAVQPVTVYVVLSTITGNPVTVGNSLFCTADCITNGAYRLYLTQAGFGLHAYWQCAGLAAYLFEPQEEADTDALSAYYGGTEDARILSLFPAYFLSDFADSRTMAIAKGTARALTESILSSDGLPAYLSDGDRAAYREQWLASLGIEIDLSALYTDAAREAAGMTWSFPKDDALMLSSDKIAFSLSRTEWLTSPDEVYSFMVTYFEGVSSLLSRLRTEAPDFYAKYTAGGLPKTYVHLEDIEPPAVSCAKGDQAYVGEAIACWHEVLHTMIPSMRNDHWLSEGTDMLLELPLCDMYYADAPDMKSFYYYLVDGEWVASFLQGDDLTFRAQAIRCYQKLAEWPASAEEVSRLSLYEAFGYARSLHPELAITGPAFAITSLAEYTKYRFDGDISGSSGNELSYAECLIFAEYLVSKYGLDPVIAAVSDLDAYYRILPDGFEPAYEEFIASLGERFR